MSCMLATTNIQLFREMLPIKRVIAYATWLSGLLFYGLYPTVYHCLVEVLVAHDGGIYHEYVCS